MQKRTKVLRGIMLLLMSFLVAVMMTACGSGGGGGNNDKKDPGDPIVSLIGTWKLIESNGEDISDLNISREYTATRVKNIGGCNTEGTYKVEGDEIIFQVDTWDDGCSYTEGQTWTFTYTLTANTHTTYIEEDNDGESYYNEFERVSIE